MNEILLKLFLEREKLKDKIFEAKEILQKIINKHYNIGAPLNDNVLKFDNKQLLFLYKNLKNINEVLEILGK